MSKAASMAKVSVKGGFHLLWGLVASTVISSVGTIFIANLLGDTNYGLYSIALVAPGLIVTFRDWGMSLAITKYTSQNNAENKPEEIRNIFASGILFESALGAVLSVVSFSLSGFLANLYSLPEIAPLIQIASLTILTSALLTTAQAAFTGLERMEFNSIALVIQSIVKTIIVITLVVLGFGPLGAVIGAVSAMLIASLIAALFMGVLFRALPNPNKYPLEFRQTIKNMFKYGFPLSIANIISTFQNQFYAFILPIFVAPDLIGNYGIAGTFVVLITFFATPVSTMLFPAFAKLDPRKDHETLKYVFQFSVKYASLIVVPGAAIVMTLSSPGISVLFPKFTMAPLFLTLLAIGYFSTAFGGLSVGNLLNGQGQTRFSLKLSLINFAIGFPLSILLISQFGIIGLIVTTLTSGFPSLIIALRWINEHYGVTVDWSSSARILLSGAVASSATYAMTLLVKNNWVALVFGSIAFLLIFTITAIATHAINKIDVIQIRESMTALGPLERPANFFLNIVERFITVLQS